MYWFYLEFYSLFNLARSELFSIRFRLPQCWSEIIETNAKNGVVFDATSNEQPI